MGLYTPFSFGNICMRWRFAGEVLVEQAHSPSAEGMPVHTSAAEVVGRGSPETVAMAAA